MYFSENPNLVNQLYLNNRNYSNFGNNVQRKNYHVNSNINVKCGTPHPELSNNTYKLVYNVLPNRIRNFSNATMSLYDTGYNQNGFMPSPNNASYSISVNGLDSNDYYPNRIIQYNEYLTGINSNNLMQDFSKVNGSNYPTGENQVYQGQLQNQNLIGCFSGGCIGTGFKQVSLNPLVMLGNMNGRLYESENVKHIVTGSGLSVRDIPPFQKNYCNDLVSNEVNIGIVDNMNLGNQLNITQNGSSQIISPTTNQREDFHEKSKVLSDNQGLTKSNITTLKQKSRGDSSKKSNINESKSREIKSHDEVELYGYKNSIINISLKNDKAKALVEGKKRRIIIYQSDYPRERVIRGITHIEVNLDPLSINKLFGKDYINLLEVEYIDSKTGKKCEPQVENISLETKYRIESGKVDFWVYTNINNNKYIIRLIFGNEKNATEFSVPIQLENEKFLERNKIKIITKEFMPEIDDLFHMYPISLTELEENKCCKDILNKLKEKLKKRELWKDSFITLKDIIDAIKGSLLKEDIKNRLLILCFDIVYDYIKGCNRQKGMTGYLSDFLNNYNIGYSKKNNNNIIIWIDQQEDHIKEESKSDKRKCPNEEECSFEPCIKKLKVTEPIGNGSKQTNRISESDSLLVDR